MKYLVPSAVNMNSIITTCIDTLRHVDYQIVFLVMIFLSVVLRICVLNSINKAVDLSAHVHSLFSIFAVHYLYACRVTCLLFTYIFLNLANFCGRSVRVLPGLSLRKHAHGCKNCNFQMKIFNIFLIFA